MLTDEQKNLRDEAITESLKQIQLIISNQTYVSSSYQSPLTVLVNATEKLAAIE